MSEAQVKIEAARDRWNKACRSWSADDGLDILLTVSRGEGIMFAATDLICALEDAIGAEAGR